jgi:hypothetical protein
VDTLNNNCPEKLHTKHATMIRTGNLNCWREDVEDKRLLMTDSTSTADIMTVRYDGRTSNSEPRFREIYSNKMNGIQQPRLTSYESVGILKTQEAR